MGLFDRFKKSRTAATPPDPDETAGSEESVELVDDELEPAAGVAEEDDADEFAPPPKEAPLDRGEKGPFDISESSPDGNRLNLGALSVPVIDGMQVRLETEEGSDRVLAVTLVHNKAAMQLQVFAAPRGEGIWKPVRDELAAGIRRRGGRADELYTDLGNELVSQLPVRAKDGRTGVRVTRFAGVDGPRWFLRAVFSGAGVTDKDARAALAELMRGTIVNRGEEARPPRELIPLTPPTVTRRDDGSASVEAQKGNSEDLNPFERGPEIAEIR